MSIIDEKGKLFGKLSILDIAVVLVIVLAIGGVYISKSKTIKISKPTTVVYTAELIDLSKDIADGIKPGDILNDSAKNTDLGKIIEVVEKKPYELINENKQNGSYVKAVVPNRYVAKVVIENNAATVKKDETMISDFDIKVGKTINVRSTYYVARGVILDFTVKKQGGSR